jgi:hypothetical protein
VIREPPIVATASDHFPVLTILDTGGVTTG